MARYRRGPYFVEERYTMIDQDGERAHQQTFAETPAETSVECAWLRRARRRYGYVESRPTVLVTDANIDYRSKILRETVVPLGVWERYGDPYVF